MKKTLMNLGVISIFLVLTLSMVSAIGPPDCTGNPGSIWTTRDDCGTEQQDVNEYSIEEKVFINGKDFCLDSYDWTITGQPGGASEDPGVVVASGNETVDSNGDFCFEAYIVQADDGGVYSVDFGNKNDNYRVDRTLPLVPEFGLIAGALAIIGSIGLFFIVRRK